MQCELMHNIADCLEKSGAENKAWGITEIDLIQGTGISKTGGPWSTPRIR